MAAPDINALVATGYGRIAVANADWRITEISCHARGASHLAPGARTVIDLGGQDAKVITLDDDGRPLDFEMNDRCAAGTGRFFEVMAGALNVTLPELGDLALQATAPAPISSMCTVFAESEVVGLLAEGQSVSAIAAGLCDSVARRVLQMANRLTVIEPVVFCGGVAHNRGVVAALRRIMGMDVTVPNNPQLVGAMGAALLAVERST
jgi:predicted CoA-substrate-specific enzyme activase